MLSAFLVSYAMLTQENSPTQEYCTATKHQYKHDSCCSYSSLPHVSTFPEDTDWDETCIRDPSVSIFCAFNTAELLSTKATRTSFIQQVHGLYESAIVDFEEHPIISDDYTFNIYVKNAENCSHSIVLEFPSGGMMFGSAGIAASAIYPTGQCLAIADVRQIYDAGYTTELRGTLDVSEPMNLIKDAAAAIMWAKDTYPNAKLYIGGASGGAATGMLGLKHVLNTKPSYLPVDGCLFKISQLSCTETPSMKTKENLTFTWNTFSNRLTWENVPAEYCPESYSVGDLRQFSHMFAFYIGRIDGFIDENMNMAHRMMSANIETHLFVSGKPINHVLSDSEEMAEYVSRFL